MKKLLKPEIEFIKFETADVITTSGGGDTVNLASKQITDTSKEQNAHTSQDFSSGLNSLWNINQ